VARPRIVVAGAGSIGCYVGGMLALGRHDVTLLLRPRLAAAIGAHGLRLTDLDGRDRTLAPGDIGLSVDPGSLRTAEIILVTVKSGDTGEMADLILAQCPGATVVSLQNGVDNVPLLRSRLPGACVVAGMVPFNVAQTQADGEAPRFHRSTSGVVTIDAGHAALRDALQVDGLECATHPDMAGLAWSKLALNMNNALNALSGLPLREQLSQRMWRRILAAQIAELIGVTRRARLSLPPIEGIRPAIIPLILRLPDILFQLVARRMLAIDPRATSSMAEDLASGRQTEVRFLQGAVSRLAAAAGVSAPIADAVVAAVEETERTGRRWSARELAAYLRDAVAKDAT